MPNQTKRTRPCEVCRARHLKCDGDGSNPCSNCKRSEVNCVRASKNFRFKTGTKPKRSLSFSNDQTWLETSQTRISFVDETPEVASATTNADASALDESQENDTMQEICNQSPAQAGESDPATYHSLPSPSISNSILSEPGLQHDSLTSHLEQTIETSNLGASPTLSMHAQSMTTATPSIMADTTSSPIFTSTSVESSNTLSIGLQEACLIRHFVEDLAHSFDATDRDAHYTITVPKRAMHSAMLMYAICTASARHLTRLWFKRHSSNSIVVFKGVYLPELNEDSAIHYHNICLSLLIDFSNDPSQGSSEDALAAATILRFYEQVDTSLTGLDTETYQNVVQSVMHAQQSEALFTLESIEGPPDSGVTAGLRYSACLIALRQEIWSVLLYRRPFRLPVAANLDYSQLGPTEDFAWVNRILIWCADILRFCFGPETAVDIASTASGSAFERWDTLKAFEETWTSTSPPCFKPLYYFPADPTSRTYFPAIWLHNDAQIIGMQHLEVGRMLLSVYNPRRQRVGIGSRAMDKAIEHQLRQSILRICGMALPNKSFQGGMTGAAIGIAIGGEYFHDPGEQEAIIEFLNILDEEHAWPTKPVVDALQEAWRIQRVERAASVPQVPQGPASV